MNLNYNLSALPLGLFKILFTKPFTLYTVHAYKLLHPLCKVYIYAQHLNSNCMHLNRSFLAGYLASNCTLMFDLNMFAPFIW